MPIYEYRCGKCKRVHEVLQKMGDKPLKKCSECSGPLEKLISRTSFQLKGTGWYATDYPRKGSGAKSEAGGDTSSSETGSSAAASDASAAKKSKDKDKAKKSS